METGELAALYEKEFRQEGARSSEPIKVSSLSR